MAPSTPKTGEEYGSSSFFIGYETGDGNIQLIPRFYKNGQNGWPETVKIESLGKTTTDSRAQDQFAYERLGEYLKDFEAKYKTKRENSTSVPEQAARQNTRQVPQNFGGQYNSPVNPQPVQRETPQNMQPSFQNPSPNTVQPKGYDDDLPF